MLVKEIMTKNVVTIAADASVFDACMMYKEKKVGCLVVVDNETCVGVVTERDLIERSICQRRDPEKTKVREIMSQNIKVVYALDTAEKALETMKPSCPPGLSRPKLKSKNGHISRNFWWQTRGQRSR